MSPVKRALLAISDFPQYAVGGLHPPQDLVEIHLEGLGAPRDVTRGVVVAALRPFSIALTFESGEQAWESAQRVNVRLVFTEAVDGAVLGYVRLKPLTRIALPGHELIVFRTAGSRSFGVSRLEQTLFYARQAWRRQRRSGEKGFKMAPSELRDLYVFYHCPRPVYLVTVEDGRHTNLFPMDLVGPTSSPFFLLALRSTSPSIASLCDEGRLALAGVPLDASEAAYGLGTHHRRAGVDWKSLPFRTEPSPALGLRVMEGAVNLRELRVREHHEIGSHFLFIAETEQASDGGATLQMCHLHGFMQAYLERRGRSLPGCAATGGSPPE